MLQLLYWDSKLSSNSNTNTDNQARWTLAVVELYGTRVRNNTYYYHHYFYFYYHT